MVESNSKNGNTENLRRSVFALLDENPYLTAKTICEKLDLPYKEKYRYLNKLKNDWKSYRENERGSNCSSVHGWRGWCHVPDSVSRDLAVQAGWVPTKAKNHWLLWKDTLGRMEWFEKGRVNLYVRSPVNEGRIKQLVCHGFSFTGLITDNKILDQVLVTIRYKGAHYVFNTGQPLPKTTIDYFDKNLGIVIKVGDVSHPKGIEVISRVPDWAERMDLFLEKLDSFFSANSYGKDYSKKPNYIV
jgi:hypothetical protein